MNIASGKRFSAPVQLSGHLLPDLPGKPEPSARRASRADRAWGLLQSPEKQMRTWIYTQATNVSRHASGIQMFQKGEFGTTVAAPSESQRLAAKSIDAATAEKVVRQKQSDECAKASSSAKPGLLDPFQVPADQRAERNLDQGS